MLELLKDPQKCWALLSEEDYVKYSSITSFYYSEKLKNEK